MKRCLPLAHPRSIRGLSLIELMVALVLGLIVTGSALTLVMTNRQTFTATENLSRVQESTRIAFELMNRELRAAGSNPCDSSLAVYNALVKMDAKWWSNWGDLEGAEPGIGVDTAPGLLGYSGATAFPDAAFGTAQGNRIAGTDAFEMKAAVPFTANNAVLTLGMSSDGKGDITVSSASDVETGDLLLICNFNHATVFRATGVASGAIKHAAGGGDADNSTDGLPRNNPIAATQYDLGSVISRVHATRWYIGANGRDTDGDGVADGRSLFRESLVNNAGTLGTSTDEIAPGVTDMQVGYLVAGAADYVDASAVAAWSDEASPVVAIRVELTLEGEGRIGPAGETLARTMVHTVALRGRAG